MVTKATIEIIPIHSVLKLILHFSTSLALSILPKYACQYIRGPPVARASLKDNNIYGTRT